MECLSSQHNSPFNFLRRLLAVLVGCGGVAADVSKPNSFGFNKEQYKLCDERMTEACILNLSEGLLNN